MNCPRRSRKTCWCQRSQAMVDRELREHLWDPSCWDHVELGRLTRIAEAGML